MRKKISSYVLMCLFILLISNVSPALCSDIDNPDPAPIEGDEGFTDEEKEAREAELNKLIDEMQEQAKQNEQRNQDYQNQKQKYITESKNRQLEKENPDIRFKEISGQGSPDRKMMRSGQTLNSNSLPSNHKKEYTRYNTNNDKLAAILEYAVAKYAVAYESYNIAKQSEEPEVRKLIPKYLRSYREAAADLLTLLRDNELYEPQEPKNIAKKFNDQLREEGKDTYETQQGNGLSSDKLDDIKKAMKKNNTTAVIDYVDKHYKNKKNADYAKKMRQNDRKYNQDISEETIESENSQGCKCNPEEFELENGDLITKWEAYIRFDDAIERLLNDPNNYIVGKTYEERRENAKARLIRGGFEEPQQPVKQINDAKDLCPSCMYKFTMKRPILQDLRVSNIFQFNDIQPCHCDCKANPRKPKAKSLCKCCIYWHYNLGL